MKYNQARPALTAPRRTFGTHPGLQRSVPRLGRHARSLRRNGGIGGGRTRRGERGCLPVRAGLRGRLELAQFNVFHDARQYWTLMMTRRRNCRTRVVDVRVRFRDKGCWYVDCFRCPLSKITESTPPANWLHRPSLAFGGYTRPNNNSADCSLGTPREKRLAPLLLFGMRFQKLLHFH
jgi:hypothetical protein